MALPLVFPFIPEKSKELILHSMDDFSEGASLIMSSWSRYFTGPKRMVCRVSTGRLLYTYNGQRVNNLNFTEVFSIVAFVALRVTYFVISKLSLINGFELSCSPYSVHSSCFLFLVVCSLMCWMFLSTCSLLLRGPMISGEIVLSTCHRGKTEY